MALYKKDYKLEKAERLIDSLNNSEERDLIKYYIQKKDDRIEWQNKRLKEYQEFFNIMSSFLPQKNIIYGNK
jgi:hypothetical protein